MVKLSDIELPMIFKNRLLFSHGIYNNWNIHSSEVTKSLDMTDWEDQKNRSLFLSHSERDAQKWVGRIENPYIQDGELYGDLEIHDADLALKLGPGKAPLGVSAEIKWPKQYADPIDFSYRGFAVVINPEIHETMVNFSEEEKEDGFNTAKLHVPFKVDTTNFSEDPEIKQILEEQNKDVTEEVEEPSAKIDEDVKEEVVAKADQPGEDLMSAERGFKKMENNANNVIPEVKEEEVVETPVVETKEVVEEEAKADFSEFNSKFEALSAKVIALEENFAKFSEAAKAEEEKEEEVKEEEKAEFSEETTEEAVVEEEVVVEESKEEPTVVEEEAKEEVVEEAEVVEEEGEAKAEFSELANKIDKLADAISKKEAAPMSTAEFGSNGNDKGNAVIDRLTNFLTN